MKCQWNSLCESNLADFDIYGLKLLQNHTTDWNRHWKNNNVRLFIFVGFYNGLTDLTIFRGFVRYRMDRTYIFQLK